MKICYHNIIISIANSFLSLSFKDKIFINPMKLQKLIYLTYKEYLNRYNSRIFSDNFLVWKYGPTLEFLHNLLSPYKDKHIVDYIYEYDRKRYLIVESLPLKLLIEEVWFTYRHYTARQLADITMIEDGAWSKANSEELYYIPNTYIQEESKIKSY